jgi:hypothetical protein
LDGLAAHLGAVHVAATVDHARIDCISLCISEIILNRGEWQGTLYRKFCGFGRRRRGRGRGRHRRRRVGGCGGDSAGGIEASAGDCSPVEGRNRIHGLHEVMLDVCDRVEGAGTPVLSLAGGEHQGSHASDVGRGHARAAVTRIAVSRNGGQDAGSRGAQMYRSTTVVGEGGAAVCGRCRSHGHDVFDVVRGRVRRRDVNIHVIVTCSGDEQLVCVFGGDNFVVQGCAGSASPPRVGVNVRASISAILDALDSIRGGS